MKKILFIFSLLLFSVFAKAQETNFEIKLKSGSFTPEVTTDFQKAINPRIEESNHEHIYRLVQFQSMPTRNQKKEIEEAGLELVNYISNMAFIVKIQNNTSATSLENLNIRSLDILNPGYKISPQLTKEELPDWAMSNDMIQLNIKYYSESDMEQVTEFISNNDGRIVFNLAKANAMTIIYNAEKIYKLAANPLIQWIEPISRTAVPDGIIAQNSVRQNTLNTSYLGGRKYDGTGVVVGLSDDGAIGPHIDTKGRVTMHTTDDDDSHGDNTSGIFIGAGNLNPLIGGMAPGADINIFKHIPNGSLGSHSQIVNGEAHLADFNMVITSTSWSQDNAGIYSISSEFGDQQIFDNQQMMHVFSAGNAGEADHDYGAGPGWANVTGGYKAGKNVICVGNVDPDGVLATSSGRGPASDGRIKPDICAQGNGTSTTGPNNTYDDFGGTSASSPATAGVFTQIYQAYKDLNGGDEPETALIKAALLNTATDAGNPGPDFKHGWGLINGLKAVRIIEDNRYIRADIDQNENNTHTVSVPENVSEVRIMTYWAEVGGNPISGVGLVNDIDMEVLTPDAVVHNPWVLDHTPDPALLDADAVQGIDRINNMEQVSIKDPVSGDYTVKLSGFAIPEGPQVYYVVYEFIYNAVELTYPIGGEGFVPGETEVIRWDASEGTENIMLEYTIDGGNTYTTISSSISSSAIGYNWTVPEELSNNVKLRISRGDQVDESDTTFTIVDVPQNIDITHICADSIGLTWDPIPDVSMYEVSLLGEKYMDSIGVTTTNTFNVIDLGLNPLEEHWFSVRAVVAGGKGRRAIAINQQPGNVGCNLMNDMAVLEILNSPVEFTPCSGTENFTISTLISNVGITDQSNFEISYQFNSAPIVTEIFEGTITPGEQVNYNFATPWSIPATGAYTLTISVNLSEDQNDFNDVSVLDFVAAGAAATLDFQEDFETSGIMPSGWFVTSNDEDITWTTETGVVGISGNPTTTAFMDNYNYNEPGQEDILTTEYFDLKDIILGAVLHFDLAKAQFDEDFQDALRVEVSTDCGASFTTIYEKEDLELSTLPDYDDTDNWVPLSGDHWRTEEIDLTPYVGEVALFRFININGWGSGTFLDNINVNQLLVSTEETFISKINLYPNPANQTVNINLSNQITTNINIVLANSLGQITSNVISTGGTTTMDVSNYATGLYFVTVTADGISETKKLIIE